MNERAWPQDPLVLASGGRGAGQPGLRPRSVALSVLLSLPLLGYFVWYYRATRDCGRLLERDLDPWPWLALLFPGLLLLVPYAYAQAKLVARVELATAAGFSTGGYVGLCLAGVLMPALMPLALQPRLNRAATANPGQLDHARAALAP